MKITLVLCVILAAVLRAQAPDEEDALRVAMGEAGNSPTEMIRALEKHLAKFPQTKNRGEIERALVKSAIDAKDNARIVQYGEKFIQSNGADLVVLERVTRILSGREDRPSNQRALDYAAKFVAGLQALENQKPDGGRMDAQLRDDLDKAFSRALIFQARAQGHLGNFAEALDHAKRAYAFYPSSEAASEAAAILLKQGKTQEAIPFFADAFITPDPRITEEDRRAIRERFGQVYRQAHQNETGMGDAILAAYDRYSTASERRKARLRAADPNAGETDPLEFTVSGLNGEKLQLKSLRGKVVVLDFWATWCGPCRVQYPVYEMVREKFSKRQNVVFLGINTDQDRSVVAGFLKENQWNKQVYFEDGLSSLLRVTGIPSTIVFNRKGEMSARLNGFVPDRFADMLTERIEEALAQ
ncbi:MAG: TlpA family protein disulfide reductase [Candidatus Solibacter usitatus]|nr:TlpA family protein disulfide reductase [Candidatus Solibacter usitatus]